MNEHGIRNDLCSGCGRWHDHTGESLLGWTDWRGTFWPLPPGHMPSNRPFDDSGGRRYGFCVMAAVADALGVRGAGE